MAASSGSVAWKPVSKHATWGRLGRSVAAAPEWHRPTVDCVVVPGRLVDRGGRRPPRRGGPDNRTRRRRARPGPTASIPRVVDRNCSKPYRDPHSQPKAGHGWPAPAPRRQGAGASGCSIPRSRPVGACDQPRRSSVQAPATLTGPRRGALTGIGAPASHPARANRSIPRRIRRATAPFLGRNAPSYPGNARVTWSRRRRRLPGRRAR